MRLLVSVMSDPVEAVKAELQTLIDEFRSPFDLQVPIYFLGISLDVSEDLRRVIRQLEHDDAQFKAQLDELLIWVRSRCQDLIDNIRD